MEGKDCDCQGKMTVGMWIDSWKTPDVEFHSETLNELFDKYKDRMLTQPGMKIFVPMCGKAVEMKWLVDHGYTVVGLEVAPVPCKAFFDENKISYDVEDIGSIPGKVYKSKDVKQNIKIYCCDYFLFTPDMEGQFSGIWDSGALNAMDQEDQEKYINVIKPLMEKGCVNMTEFVTFKDWPSGMPLEEISRCFGEGYLVEDVTTVEATQKMKDIGCESCQLYIITKNP